MRALFVLLSMLVLHAAEAAPRIAVVDFDTNQYSAQLAGAQLADYVVDELVNTGLFDVVEREKLQSIATELGFSGSGMVDPSSAAQMGRLLGAKYLLTGRVISLGAEEKSFGGYGINTRSTILSLAVSVRVVDTETGSVAFSTRTTTNRTINETQALAVRSSTAYNALSEQAAMEAVTGIVKSGRFASAGDGKTEALMLVVVDVQSSPPNADVEVDGVFYGNAGGPLTLPSGLRSVRVSLAGHSVWEKKVMISAGTRITATLAPEEK